jgi:flagellar biosynthesis/type III secretory pathway M-ring protein FliF/YscJ
MNFFQDPSEKGDVEGPKSLDEAKSKMIMDFGLNRSAPERVTLEVLRELIKAKPDRICQVARQWIRRESPEK